MLQYEDKSVFLGNITNKLGKLFFFSTSINKENSNFQNSPLIVPTFYNMGQNNNKSGLNAFIIGNNNYTIINETIAKDNVIILLFLTIILCLLLGMGLPTTANYVVVASLMATVLVDVGNASGFIFPLIAVHLFVFYFGEFGLL